MTTRLNSNEYFLKKRYGIVEYIYSYVGNVNIYELDESHYEGLSENLYFCFEDFDILLSRIEEIHTPNNKIILLNCELKEDINYLDNFDIKIIRCSSFEMLFIFECTNCFFEITGMKSIRSFQVGGESSNSTFKLSNNEIDQVYIEGSPSVTFEDSFNKTPCKYIFEESTDIKVKLYKVNLKSISFTNSTFEELLLREIKCESKLIFDFNDSSEDDEVFEKLHFIDCNFNSVEINTNNFDFKCVNLGILKIENSNNFIIDSLNISSLELTNENSHNLVFKDLIIENILFDGFTVGDNTKFINSTLKDGSNSLKISKSILGGLLINPSFLHYFKKLEFNNSSINGINLYGFQPIEGKVIQDAVADIKGKIDLSRELGTFLKNQGNNHDYLIYKSLEQNFRFSNAKFNSVDWWILGLNKISNYHGTKPQFSLICLVVLLSLYLFLLNFEFQNKNLFYNSISFFKDNFSYFFNPITFISDIESVTHEFSFSFRVFDVFYKIMYTYLIYQFIAAFRKFNK